MTGAVIQSAGLHYFAIPKCACSTMKQIFAWWEHKPIPPDELHILKHWKMAEYDPASTLIPVAVIRHPLERIASCWREKIMDHSPGNMYGGFNRWPNRFWPQMPLGAFVDSVCTISDEHADNHFKSQHCFVPDDPRLILLRVESLQTDFDWLCDRLNRDRRELPRLTVSKKRNDAFDPRRTAMLLVRYADDFKRFQYDA